MVFKNIGGPMMEESKIEKLLKAVMDPKIFKYKDSSLQTVNKLSREFNDLVENDFYTKKMAEVSLVKSYFTNLILFIRIWSELE